MITISKIKLKNFKRFENLELDVKPDINILIGDNEAGKSTILQAIDLVARGSVKRIENIGLDKLFNVNAMQNYLNGDKNLNNLPDMFIELYFESDDNMVLVGQNNSSTRNCAGIKLLCEFNDDYSKDVQQLMTQENASFPLEFYKITFETFSGKSYNSYTRKLNSISIDNATIGNPRTMHEYVNDIYNAKLTDIDRTKTKYAYKQNKIDFQNEYLNKFNASIAPYKFTIKESSNENIETDITLSINNIPLENKGTGTQCFIKTKLAINKDLNKIDTVLIEEPENHLSYSKMLALINLIQKNTGRQLFISTHSDLIATRLNLQNCILLHSFSTNTTSLYDLKDDTANFFMKAPNSNMLQFILSPKSILVEGNAEYILMEKLYKNVNKDIHSSEVGVIAVGGICFKRYLEIARLLKNKVAVITDNDYNYEEKIKEYYKEYEPFKNIKIFADKDNNRNTFEVCIYEDNKELCDSLFMTPNRKLSIKQYMLKNKTDSAYQLSIDETEGFTVPQYIKDAIEWIDD